MNNMLIGCGQITWIRFGPSGAEWQAPEIQVLAEIAQAGYDGWLIVETDVTQKPTALESITVSREYLRSCGV